MRRQRLLNRTLHTDSSIPRCGPFPEPIRLWYSLAMSRVSASARGDMTGGPHAVSNYDKLSRWYDLMSGPFESRWRDLAVRRLNLAAGQTVLEIGCGTGRGLIRLAEATETTGRIYGVDLSGGMCRVARTRVARSGRPEVAVIQGDAAALPFASGSFSAVFMSFTLELFSSEVAAPVLTECHRVLQASGRLGVVTLEQRGPATSIMRLYGWASERFPKWIDCRPIPVADWLSGHGFHLTEMIQGSIGGLPVAIVIAQKNSP